MKRLVVVVTVSLIAMVAAAVIAIRSSPSLITLLTAFFAILSQHLPSPPPSPAPHDLLNYKVERQLTFSQPTGLAWNRDQSRLAVLNNSHIDVLDTRDWRILFRIERVDGTLSHCIFFTDGNAIIANSAYATKEGPHYFAAVWDGSDGHLIREIERPQALPTKSNDRMTACDLSSDGTMFAASSMMSDYVVVYGTADWTVLAINRFMDTHSGVTGVSDVRFFHHSKRIAVTAGFGALFISDVGGERNSVPVLRSRIAELDYHALEVDADDRLIAVGGGRLPPNAHGVSPLAVYDVLNGTARPIMNVQFGAVDFVRWLGNGELLTGGDSPNRMLVVDPARGPRYAEDTGVDDRPGAAAVGDVWIAAIRGNSVVIYRRQ
ncbi:MAG: hypothetical protein PW843_24040 [Azospirillaceae bacterium]|nr:hypothetical protein [Azospirillaceae bacterium]